MLNRISVYQVICNGCGSHLSHGDETLFRTVDDVDHAMNECGWIREFEFEPLTRARIYCPQCAVGDDNHDS